MRHLDFSRLASEAEINEQLQEMVERELLRPEEARAVDLLPIMNFIRSSLGQRILASPRVNREVPFNLLYPAGAIFENPGDPGEELLLQGIIDLYFAEGDELVLVDYKTDRITAMNRPLLIETYGVQIQLYKTALERILGQRVKESILYFFDSEEAVTVT
jgi:ATP-dependent helicase/nuclease subunit A